MAISQPIPAYIHPQPAHVPSGELLEQNAEVKLNYGSQKIRRIFFDDISIEHVQHRFNGRHHLHRENPDGIVSLGFNLKGAYAIHQMGQTYQVRPGQHNIVHTKGYSNSYQNLEFEGESFSINIQPQFFEQAARDGNASLKRFLDEMAQDKPAVMSVESLYTNVELERAIRAVLDCPYAGGMKRMYLLSKCIEILVLQAEAFDRAGRPAVAGRLGKADRESLAEAKAYVEAHLAAPPSLSELSRIVGINEYKLKRGFKEMYGATVFGHLSNVRLERAKAELLGGGKRVGEIAAELGYSSSQHFSRAFKEKYGLPPGQFLRRS